MNKRSNTLIEEQTTTFKDYLNLIRGNLFPILLITLTSLTFSIVYAVNATNIYQSTVTVKIESPKGSILDSPLFPSMGDFGKDRFIANEIEFLQSNKVKTRIAQALADTFKQVNDFTKFSLLLDKSMLEKNVAPRLKRILDIRALLDKADIKQKRGLDIVTIAVESPSSYEASLIANTYAEVYTKMNLESNRNQIALVKKYLEIQKNEKLADLNFSEELLKKFQESGGVMVLESQVEQLIGKLSDFESQKSMSEIELSSVEKALDLYKKELKEKNPQISDYVENFASEEYIKFGQTEIAKLEYNRDQVLATGPNETGLGKEAVNEYNKKITELRANLNKKLNAYKTSILVATPDELKTLTQKIIEEEIKKQSLVIRIDQLGNLVKEYERKFGQLPKSSIELARLQRNRESLEKLYILIEQKYQEAMINEQSTPANVTVIDFSEPSEKHSKPNRMLIILVGFVLGLGLSIGFVFTRNYFDNTVKTPEDIQRRDITVLSWIPLIEGVSTNGENEFEFIVAKKPDSIPSEAFRALRTRVQFSKLPDKELKTILVTSSAPSEGKTMICNNLAGSFAHSNKKTLVIDCDLRKPRVHSFYKTKRYPGLVDYLFGQATLDEIIRKSEMNYLHFITAGTIPPNPAELLESSKMGEFLDTVSAMYDYILIDSPPVIAVTDSEIVSRLADATILVVSANNTEIELMEQSVNILRNNNVNLMGTVLNNFVYKSSYGSYYKYYYYYTRPRKTEKNIFPPASQN